MSVFTKIADHSAVINGIKAVALGTVVVTGLLSLPVSASPGAPGSGPCNSCIEEQQKLQSNWGSSWSTPTVRHPGQIYYPAPVTRGAH